MVNYNLIVFLKEIKFIEVNEPDAGFCLNKKWLLYRVTIFSLPKRRTFFDNNYYQPYKLFSKAGKIFLDVC